MRVAADRSLRSKGTPPDPTLGTDVGANVATHTVRGEQRKLARASARKPKSITAHVLRRIAVAMCDVATKALVGDAGSRRKSFPWEMSPQDSKSLFLHAERAGLCETSIKGKSAIVVFRCFEDLLAVFDKDATFFMSLGYEGE